jgi:pimeloyl-ACP methyl ester carboxylesterase
MRRGWFTWALERRGVPPKQCAEILNSQYGDTPPDDPEFAGYIQRLYNRKGQMRTLYNVLSNARSFGALDTLTRPDGFPAVYLFWGRSNHVLPIAAGEEFSQRLQPDHFEVFEGCGHLVMREQPEVTSQRIESFLAECRGRAEANAVTA